MGMFPSSLGPMKLNFSGNRDGSRTNSNHNGNRYKEANIAMIRIHLIVVPTAGVCRYSSACSKLSKNVVGNISTLGVLSFIKKTRPSKIRSEELSVDICYKIDTSTRTICSN